MDKWMIAVTRGLRKTDNIDLGMIKKKKKEKQGEGGECQSSRRINDLG